MLIEKVKRYEGDEEPVKALEEEWGRCQAQLKEIAKHGLKGMGAPFLREDIALKICTAKHELLAMGAYEGSRDFKDYRGEV